MTQSDDATILRLPAALDADAATALIAELNMLSRSGETRLDAAAVASVPPGYLQILVSAFKTFPMLGIADPSTAFVEAFAEYGLAYPAAQAIEAEATEQTPAVDAVAEGQAAMPVAEPVAAQEPAAAPTAEPVAAEEQVTVTADEPVAAAPNTAVPDDAAPAAAADNPAGDPNVPKTILTIDDSRTMRDMLKMALGGAGFTVIQAVDGQDGLKALAQQPVDLIITDINMPKLDGYGVIRAVRSDPAHNGTPILVLSTEGEQESKDIAKDAGATGWIVKPFDPDGLVEIVNTVCG
jgi:two-component system, chemotaxis family, chemotaxis protein CheY